MQINKRNPDANQIFRVVEPEIKVVTPSPMERQRQKDGTQHTAVQKSALAPRGNDVPLVLGEDIEKSASLEQPSRETPEDIVKAYLAKK